MDQQGSSASQSVGFDRGRPDLALPEEFPDLLHPNRCIPSRHHRYHEQRSQHQCCAYDPVFVYKLLFNYLLEDEARNR